MKIAHAMVGGLVALFASPLALAKGPGGAMVYRLHGGGSDAVYAHQKSINSRGVATLVVEHLNGSASVAKVQATGAHKRILSDSPLIGRAAVALASRKLGKPVVLGSTVSNGAGSLTRRGNLRVGLPGSREQTPADYIVGVTGKGRLSGSVRKDSTPNDL